MSRFFLILKLKFREIFALRSLMLLLFILPILFGLLTASAVISYRQPLIQLAVIDEDQTTASANMLARLDQEGRSIYNVSSDQAQSLLQALKVDGILQIKSGFADSLLDLEQAFLVYTPAPDSLVTPLVTEAILAAVLPEYSRLVLLDQLTKDQLRYGLEQTLDLETDFQKSLDYYSEHEARLDLIFSGVPENELLAMAIFDEYSLEVFFLSLFAVLGMLGLTSQPVRQRLLASPHGLFWDYLASLVALQILGTSQIIIYMASMNLAMSSSFRGKDIYLLSVFVFFMLGLGQLLALLPGSTRHFLSIMLLAGSAFAGGCFFRLPQKLLQISSNFSPHGWILGVLRGYQALPVLVPLLLAASFLLLGYFNQARKARLAD